MITLLRPEHVVFVHICLHTSWNLKVTVTLICCQLAANQEHLDLTTQKCPREMQPLFHYYKFEISKIIYISRS